LDGIVSPIDPGIDRPLGLMFYDFDYSTSLPVPMFFHARLQSGVLGVPPESMVRAENRRGAPS
jgi:CRISPR-associated protein Cas5d